MAKEQTFFAKEDRGGLTVVGVLFTLAVVVYTALFFFQPPF